MGSTAFSSASVEFKDGKAHIRTCFTAGTKIKTKSGYKSIETIQTGDIVASANEHTGKISYKKVKQTFIRQSPRIYKLTYNDGTTLETTGDHPFFINDKGWTTADKLSNGDISPTWTGLKNSNGVVEKEIAFSESKDTISDRVSRLVMKESLAVGDIEVIEEETTVYNFEVEDDHTYFVTEVEVWVHNAEDYDRVVNKFNDDLGINNRNQDSLLDSAISRISKYAAKLVYAKNVKDGLQGLATLDEDIKILQNEALEGAHKTIDRKLRTEIESRDLQIGDKELMLTDIRLKTNIPNFGNSKEQIEFAKKEIQSINNKIAAAVSLTNSNGNDFLLNEYVSKLKAQKEGLGLFIKANDFIEKLKDYNSIEYQKASFQHNQINLLANDLKMFGSSNDINTFKKLIYRYSNGSSNNQLMKELLSIQNLKKSTNAYYGTKLDPTPITEGTSDVIEDPTGAWKDYLKTREKRSQIICSDYIFNGGYKICK
ncbi:MAG: polymorphic toxin-type HINT domain-containing protein [Leptospiraceae bacterium]|nr:polymorphic toxin-type HINT domain-containing protein [Leptospiraceae bacterium]MCZ8344850.1 polymorphic toxin-type HINT domain-containing protein [Leptospiraceae bacterium]